MSGAAGLWEVFVRQRDMAVLTCVKKSASTVKSIHSRRRYDGRDYRVLSTKSSNKDCDRETRSGWTSTFRNRNVWRRQASGECCKCLEGSHDDLSS